MELLDNFAEGCYQWPITVEPQVTSYVAGKNFQSIAFFPIAGELIFTHRLIHRTSILRTAEGDKNTEEIQDSAEVTELKNSLKELETSTAEWKAKHEDILDKYRRSIAESDNMRKRLTKQIEEAKIFGIQGFGKDLLEVADVLDKAVGMKDQTAEDLHQGLQMTQAQLGQVFKRHGLEAINPLNEKFDPNKHEALFQVPVPDKDVNTVVDVQKVGYALHGRTIRPALVGVSRKWFILMLCCYCDFMQLNNWTDSWKSLKWFQNNFSST